MSPPISRGIILGKLVLEGNEFSREEIDLVASQDGRVKFYTRYYIIVFGAVVGLLVFYAWKRRGQREKRKKKR